MEIQQQELAKHVILVVLLVLEQLQINVLLVYQLPYQKFITQIIHVTKHVQMEHLLILLIMFVLLVVHNVENVWIILLNVHIVLLEDFIVH